MRRPALPKLLPLALLLAILLAGAATLSAVAGNGRPVAGIGDPGGAAVPPSPMAATVAAAEIMPGNYCLSCHSAGDERLQGSHTAWRGGIEAAGVSACPAVKTMQEELFYTERLLLAIDRYQDTLPGYISTAGVESKLAAGRQGYLRLLDTPVTSLDAFVAEAQSVRFTLGKVYTGLQALDESAKRMRSLVIAFVVTLVLLVSLGWGLYNTRHVKNRAGKPQAAGLVKKAIFLLLIAAFFSLPFLRLPPQVDAASTEESLAVQTELDTVQRAGDAAGRAQARAWILARIAAHLQPVDAAQSSKTLEQALLAAEEARSGTAALWGEAAAAQEAAVHDPAKLESAGLIAAEVQAARSRAWNYRRMAEDRLAADPEQAAALLEQALLALPAGNGIYTDLDRRSIAVAWAGIDPQQAEMALKAVNDPAVRAWGLLELAQATDSPALYGLAVETAGLVQDPLQKALALAEAANVRLDKTTQNEIVAALDAVEPARRAHALAAAARLTGVAELAGSIEPAYPAAQTAAYLSLNRFEEAWNASLRIADPYDRARAQLEIVTRWVSVDAQQAAKAAEIAVPLLRDRTMRNVIQITGDASLADRIENPYDRALALTYLGRYDEAEALAGELKDTRPLVELALALVKDDPQRALALVDKLGREADKSAVLTAAAVQTGDAELFERALAMAAAARVRGDALAPVQAILDLALRFFDIDPALAEKALQQALELAERISIK